MLKIMFQPRLASQEVLIVIQGGSLPFINGVYTPYKSGYKPSYPHFFKAIYREAHNSTYDDPSGPPIV